MVECMVPLLIIPVLAALLVMGALAAVAWRWSTELIKSPHPDALSSPAEYGLPFAPVMFPSGDGLTLHGWFIPAPWGTPFSMEDQDWTGKGKGTIILGHGRFGSKDPDLKYVPFLHEAGYNCFLFDFRGHGRSEGDYTSFGYHERKDLLAAIDLLRSKGIDEVGVIGFSLGGVVAIGAAAQSEQIVAVVADGAFVELKGALARGAEERHLPSWLVRFLGPSILWLAGRRVGGNLEDSEPLRWVDRISPRALLLIHGEEDPYVSVEDVRRLYERAGEPKELWIARGAGHRRVDQVYPEEYRQRVLGFFARYLVGEGEEGRR
jgi:pimeloyl-ACP methyl ester carboxylesterase